MTASRLVLSQRPVDVNGRHPLDPVEPLDPPFLADRQPLFQRQPGRFIPLVFRIDFSLGQGPQRHIDLIELDVNRPAAPFRLNAVQPQQSISGNNVVEIPL